MKQTDETDRQIIAVLQNDPRVANKTIASEVNISESTVANRLKRLIEQKIIRITIEEDAGESGYPLLVIANIVTQTGHREAVAERIAARDDVTAVITPIALSEVVVLLFAKGYEHCEAVADEIGRFDHVEKISIDVATKVYKYTTNYGILE